mmetsp:Transcript_17784/g.36901  ORF Transcript_17784/g.36901 Transcript_17784/m.36901 type:complete len:252 (+) Transcript_17784:1658-2413(+)
MLVPDQQPLNRWFGVRIENGKFPFDLELQRGWLKALHTVNVHSPLLFPIGSSLILVICTTCYVRGRRRLGLWSVAQTLLIWHLLQMVGFLILAVLSALCDGDIMMELQERSPMKSRLFQCCILCLAAVHWGMVLAGGAFQETQRWPEIRASQVELALCTFLLFDFSREITIPILCNQEVHFHGIWRYASWAAGSGGMMAARSLIGLHQNSRRWKERSVDYTERSSCTLLLSKTLPGLETGSLNVVAPLIKL